MTTRQKIWCEGSLLHAVQTSGIFPDCKTFVDMPLRNDAVETLSKWDKLLAQGNLTNDSLRTFVRDNFEEPEGELMALEPTDWTLKFMNDQENTQNSNFERIENNGYRQLAEALHAKWPTLYRKIADKVVEKQDKYSILAVPNPFVVPGGRFREMYYWDSFFTIKGLIASGMLETVKGMIQNIQYLIDMFGFMPNGNRIYYLNRSQPPLLSWCAWAYFEATRDKNFIESIVGTLERELHFFRMKRTILLNGWKGPLYRYSVHVEIPRPESYREDLKSTEDVEKEADKWILWGDLAAAAESGRDFSSRWFSTDGPLKGKLEGTRTSQIIPVDLNSIICANLNIMAKMYEEIGDGQKAALMRKEATVMVETMQQVLWNETLGCWFDYDLATNTQLTNFQDTNFFPMFADAVHADFQVEQVVHYLHASGALNFPGGLPSTMVNSGEQWDFPNAWAPTTWVLIEGLRKCGATELAEELAMKWVGKNFDMWEASGGKMFEKYNVVSSCTQVSGGGEYVMQEGFGWTNGVVLDLLTTFPQLKYTKGLPCTCIDCAESKDGTSIPHTVSDASITSLDVSAVVPEIKNQ